ncbi:unnamed protein product [Didymodactylos carnosus]|uniref:U-box domain-containing protein n=1 Tax=Didymodactylos carnosus TaxID=1234261 RepID=A0A815AG34_9BILA|nr:unnamed protein product [Didymodactylos carnosus]CAF1256196.1 unnamed protein product [Didymodactylos carnosus]CAF3708451.1 unnamed protein product [Didymodactylos carnosus]CAF4029224.1 unnamed protein product [Didymodactylos carnosus]
MSQIVNTALTCPITGELFRDPVMADDGHTYDRKAITRWLRENKTSPITREHIELATLRTNYTVKRLVDNYRIENKLPLPVDDEEEERMSVKSVESSINNFSHFSENEEITIINRNYFDNMQEDRTGDSTLLDILSDDINTFVLHPAPLGDTIRCRIVRTKNSPFQRLEYYMHVERNNGRKIFILTARCPRFRVKYQISTNKTDIGKLKSNNIGDTHFTLSAYDQKLASIAYVSIFFRETNIFGFNGPRKMTVSLQTATIDREDEHWSNILQLHNKTPVWNEESASHVLRFHGRVTQASVKNFQLIGNDYPDHIFLQFGRVGSHTFTCDYKYPLCALQAFGIALSSLHDKLGCE